MARSTPTTKPVEPPAGVTAGGPVDDVQRAAGSAPGETVAPVNDPGLPVAAPLELEPGPPTVESVLDVPPTGDVEAAPVGGITAAPPDPLAMLGTRPCPVCEGAGEIPFNVLQSPRTRLCEECGGVGQVLTGSLISESSVAPCAGCNGAGWQDIPATVPPPPGAPPSPDGLQTPPWPGAVWDAAAQSWVPGGVV